MQLVLSRSADLLKFELGVYFHRDRSNIQGFWDLLLSQSPPTHLKYLLLDLPICDNSPLSWLAKMTRLEHLTVGLSDISGIQLPVDTFRQLKTLRVTSHSTSAAGCLWQSFAPSHLTFASISMSGGLRLLVDTEISQFFTTLVVNSPLLKDFYFGAISPISYDDLAELRSFPLRSLKLPRAEFGLIVPSPFQTVANFWPKLEVLDLESTPITLEDLVCISRYFPRLRELTAKVPGGFSLAAAHVPRLSLAQLHAQRAVWLSHPLHFSPGICFGRYYKNLESIAP